MSSSVGCRVRDHEGRRGTVVDEGPSWVRVAWDEAGAGKRRWG